VVEPGEPLDVEIPATGKPVQLVKVPEVGVPSAAPETTAALIAVLALFRSAAVTRSPLT
jgi:hypothetical protein